MILRNRIWGTLPAAPSGCWHDSRNSPGPSGGCDFDFPLPIVYHCHAAKLRLLRRAAGLDEASQVGTDPLGRTARWTAAVRWTRRSNRGTEFMEKEPIVGFIVTQDTAK